LTNYRKKYILAAGVTVNGNILRERGMKDAHKSKNSYEDKKYFNTCRCKADWHN
jgi:hypothetical protein